MFRKFVLAAALLACTAFARPTPGMTADQAKAWLAANAPGWIYLLVRGNVVASAKLGSFDDSAYPTIRYTSRADLADGVISTMIQGVEVDCLGSRYRYSGGTASDATGVTVDIPADPDWITTDNRSANGYLHEGLCEKGKGKHP